MVIYGVLSHMIHLRCISFHGPLQELKVHNSYMCPARACVNNLGVMMTTCLAISFFPNMVARHKDFPWHSKQYMGPLIFGRSAYEYVTRGHGCAVSGVNSAQRPDASSLQRNTCMPTADPPSLKRNSLSVDMAKPLCGRFRRQFVTADHHKGKTVPELSPTTWARWYGWVE